MARFITIWLISLTGFSTALFGQDLWTADSLAVSRAAAADFHIKVKARVWAEKNSPPALALAFEAWKVGGDYKYAGNGIEMMWGGNVSVMVAAGRISCKPLSPADKKAAAAFFLDKAPALPGRRPGSVKNSPGARTYVFPPDESGISQEVSISGGKLLSVKMIYPPGEGLPAEVSLEYQVWEVKPSIPEGFFDGSWYIKPVPGGGYAPSQRYPGFSVDILGQ